MFKIELQEHDGLFRPGGVPELVVISVNGVRFPYNTAKTLKELYGDINAMKVDPKAPVLPFHEPAGAVVEALPAAKTGTETNGAVSRNDTVQYIGPNDESGDLVKGNNYKVIERSKGGLIEIIDPDSPTPMRLTVQEKELRLVQKGIRVVSREEFYETTMKCDSCGEDAVLRKNKGEAEYHGSCLKCKTALKIVPAVDTAVAI